MVDGVKTFLKVDYDHASIVSFDHVKSDLVCRVSTKVGGIRKPKSRVIIIQ